MYIYIDIQHDILPCTVSSGVKSDFSRYACRLAASRALTCVNSMRSLDVCLTLVASETDSWDAYKVYARRVYIECVNIYIFDTHTLRMSCTHIHHEWVVCVFARYTYITNDLYTCILRMSCTCTLTVHVHYEWAVNTYITNELYVYFHDTHILRMIKYIRDVCTLNVHTSYTCSPILHVSYMCVCIQWVVCVYVGFVIYEIGCVIFGCILDVSYMFFCTLDLSCICVCVACVIYAYCVYIGRGICVFLQIWCVVYVCVYWMYCICILDVS